MSGDVEWWVLTNNQQATKALSKTSHMELNPSNNHMSLEVDPSLVKPQVRFLPWPTSWLKPVWDYEREDTANNFLAYRNFKIISVLFELITFAVVLLWCNRQLIHMAWILEQWIVNDRSNFIQLKCDIRKHMLVIFCDDFHILDFFLWK